MPKPTFRVSASIIPIARLRKATFGHYRLSRPRRMVIVTWAGPTAPSRQPDRPGSQSWGQAPRHRSEKRIRFGSLVGDLLGSQALRVVPAVVTNFGQSSERLRAPHRLCAAFAAAAESASCLSLPLVTLRLFTRWPQMTSDDRGFKEAWLGCPSRNAFAIPAII